MMPPEQDGLTENEMEEQRQMARDDVKKYLTDKIRGLEAEIAYCNIVWRCSWYVARKWALIEILRWLEVKEE